MPVPTDRTSLTAIRMRNLNSGEFSVFIGDSPEAATLEPGDWISVNAFRDSKFINAFSLCAKPRASLSNAEAPGEVRNYVESMIRGLPDDARERKLTLSAEDCLHAFNAMDEARRALKFSRHSGLLPDELLQSLLIGSPIGLVLHAHLASRESRR
jgi:hypothetical protein